MKPEAVVAVKLLLSEPKKIVIVPHRSPDGDAMGASLGLFHFLKKMGHHPAVIAPNDFPPNLDWLPDASQVVIFERQNEIGTALINNAEVIFLVDFNALHRTGDMEKVLQRSTAQKIMIDHHQMPEPCAQYMYSDTSFNSTCEMLYNFIVYIDQKSLLDTTIATCIYTGIVTDTGSFKFTGTSAKTHEIAAELIRLGVNNPEIHTTLFDNGSYNSLQLLGTALNNMKIIKNGTVSYTFLSNADLVTHHYIKGDTERIVNYGLSIKDFTFTAIFIEHADENIIKISFRSKGLFDVNQFARQYFDGGGHKNASGGKSKDTLSDTLKKFENIVLEINKV